MSVSLFVVTAPSILGATSQTSEGSWEGGTEGGVARWNPGHVAPRVIIFMHAKF